MTALDPYDAVLVVSFGGPEGPDEVMPFMRRVTAGRGIPDERLHEVAAHYVARGGVSPINGETRALVAALRGELGRRGEGVPVWWGNRNSAPFLSEALADALDAGARRVLAVFTSAYSSYSSCRQYRENLAQAVVELGEKAAGLQIDKVRAYALDEAFLAPVARLAGERLRELLAQGHDLGGIRVVFVTHSIPQPMVDSSGPPGSGGAYLRQHLTACEEVVARLGAELGSDPSWELAYCSRSGRPSDPWLEPDIEDVLPRLAADGVTGAVVVPVGFVADHMEVVHDLDTQAAAVAAEVGVQMLRVPTVRDDAQFVAGLVDLMEERAAVARGDRADRADRPAALCPPGCCAGRRPAAALCGADSAGAADVAPACTAGGRR